MEAWEEREGREKNEARGEREVGSASLPNGVRASAGRRPAGPPDPRGGGGRVHLLSLNTRSAQRGGSLAGGGARAKRARAPGRRHRATACSPAFFGTL